MSHPASVPLAHLKRLIAVVRTQDGSKTQKELLPLMRASLSVGRASPPSEDIIAETIRTVQQRVKHRHEKQRKKEAEETRIAALEAQAVNTRSRQRDSAAAPNTTTSASRRPKKVSKVEVTAQTRAEDQLVAALAELRVRNAQHTNEQKKLIEEERKAKTASKAAERKERKEKEAREKKEKQEKTAKQRAEELELKDKLRDKRAKQSLEAAAEKHYYEKEQKEALKRAKRIDRKIEILLDLQTEVLKAARGQKRARDAEAEDSEEDKENIEPEGEWRV
jgi:hypothetical protein